MKIKSLTLENFRGYNEKHKIDFESEITGLIGRNDAGKSSITDSLEIFFNNESVKIESNDKCVFSSNEVIKITCEFYDLPDSIILDESISTSFADEFLLNEEGNLEIQKEYKVGSKVSAPTIKIIANHPVVEESEKPLQMLKLNDLKKIGEKLGVDSSVQDKRVASYWRKAIWERKTTKIIQEIDISKLTPETKAIYERITESFPLFALFKSDRESSDSDPEAKNPIQIAVRSAQKKYETEIKQLENKIIESVIGVAKNTLEKIQEMDPDLANNLDPHLKETPKWTFNFTLNADDGVPVNKRGSGVRRLILLNFFRAEADRMKVERNSPNVLFAIEEPETSQHPDYQALLIKTLVQLSNFPNTQIIITSHVPGLVSLLPTQSIRYFQRIEKDKVLISLGTNEILEAISDSLGILSDPRIRNAKAVILVEGHSDISFLQHTCKVYKKHGLIENDFDDLKIHIIPVGGCGNIKHWVNKRIIEKMGLKWGAIFDSDIGDEFQNSQNISKINNINGNGNFAFLTRKREPENYLHTKLIKEIYDIEISYTETEDAKKKIATAIRKNPNDVLESLWEKMTFEQLREVFEFDNEKDEFLIWYSTFLTLLE
ncbi:ATP-dependent endonuclease [Leptospira levettii]|uniref:ATP-dependent endonuclease n=1 Tax=Leptospira levettii TaxID=2023178 RepID=UPI00223DC736|nr:ATP-dependent endonuclease [Leptospira levettii]MCW7496891.1 ATP-dependent endonuclease [Leptospira levettii]